jgi:hypothetical protein
LTVEE